MSQEYYESPAVNTKICPITKTKCLGIMCLNVVEKTETWTTEEMYRISHHSRKMLRCSKFPDVIWWQPKGETEK
jgi:hypothetical protein